MFRMQTYSKLRRQLTISTTSKKLLKEVSFKYILYFFLYFFWDAFQTYVRIEFARVHYIVRDLSFLILLNFTIVVWTENGDNCAKQYASTGAQKTDFTRCDIC